MTWVHTHIVFAGFVSFLHPEYLQCADVFLLHHGHSTVFTQLLTGKSRALYLDVCILYSVTGSLSLVLAVLSNMHHEVNSYFQCKKLNKNMTVLYVTNVVFSN